MGKANGIYKRSDNRWEARYKKGIGPDGRAVYGSVYGSSREEVEERRNQLIKDYDQDMKQKVPTELNLLILGAGSHGRDVKEIAESLHIFQTISFLDDNKTGEDILGVCKDAIAFKNQYSCAVVAIGDNKKRQKLSAYLKSMNYLLPKLVSPTAVISPNAVIEEGAVVMSQANIGVATIGTGCIIAPNCSIASDAIIGGYSRVDTAGIVPKGSKVPELTWIKSGELYTKKRNAG